MSAAEPVRSRRFDDHAVGSMIHTFQVQSADVDRGGYEELDLRVASETTETAMFVDTRVLACAIEYEEGNT